MTRQEIKEQLSHDQFRDGVSAAITYAGDHRKRVTQLSVIALAVLLLIGAVLWFMSYQKGIRQQDLRTALDVWESPVGQNPAPDVLKSYPTQQAKDSAALNAFGSVISKHGSSREGLIAQYYSGTIKAAGNNPKGAETDLKNVADHGGEFAPLAKLALAQVYAGQNRVSDAEALLRNVADKPNDLVSKAQAELLLAQMESARDPQAARRILNSLKSSSKDSPEVTRAADQVAAQLPK